MYDNLSEIRCYNKNDRNKQSRYSGAATFRLSVSPVVGSRISSQLIASSADPVVVDTANNTPRGFAAVERKSAKTSSRDEGQNLLQNAR